MKTSLAFWAGFIGAGAVLLGTWISYAAGGTDFSYSQWWGTMVTRPDSDRSALLGFAIHMVFGGSVGLLYGMVFGLIGRANWWLGMIGGFIHLTIAGFALGEIPAIHPAIPRVIPDPGFFTASYGAASVGTFCGVHLLYGAIVGRLYSIAATETTPPSGGEGKRRLTLRKVPVQVRDRRDFFRPIREEPLTTDGPGSPSPFPAAPCRFAAVPARPR